jgi:hypothetical protein
MQQHVLTLFFVVGMNSSISGWPKEWNSSLAHLACDEQAVWPGIWCDSTLSPNTSHIMYVGEFELNDFQIIFFFFSILRPKLPKLTKNNEQTHFFHFG